MAIRITGMYSGLDTEAIISELVSAQSVKKSKYVKEQTKLSWKMDAWKALNTKIYNFYTNTLDNMRFQASYKSKAAKVSNSNILSATVNSNSVNGLQKVVVSQLATSGKITGRDLNKDYAEKNLNVRGTTKLSALGIEGDASFDVTVGGKSTKIAVNGDMSINDVVSKLQNAGINASFDDVNHRFFLSAKSSGEAADFTLTANNEAGLDVLESLGLLTKMDTNSKEYKEYQKWAGYATDAEAYNAAIEAEMKKRAASYKSANEALEKQKETIQKEIDKLREQRGYGDDVDTDALEAKIKQMEEELYGPETQVTNADGELVYNDDGTPMMERTGTDPNCLQGKITKAQEDLNAYYDSGADDPEELQKLKDALTAATSAYNEKYMEYSETVAIRNLESQVQAIDEKIADNGQYYLDGDGNEVSGGTEALRTQVKDEFDEKVKLAQGIVKDGGYGDRKYGDQVVGQKAIITVDGTEFTSDSNDFSINGTSITVYEEGEATITVTDDVDGIYDMVKNFLTEYNSLINEMSALYNADSSKGYDPLTSEEKDSMSDSEIEEWEKKIKDSLLRRDSTLGDISDAMKAVMLQGATVNGKTMYLSDFGINTLGYFNAADNEKSAYHIDGDPDDANTKNQDDKLRAMIASDPDTVMNFFSGLSKNLYEKLTDKMKSVEGTSSAFTVYNDKLMQKEYDNYKDKIAKEETKLNNLMDKWYEKFSRMETAMAKLQSKSGGLAGLLGGQ